MAMYKVGPFSSKRYYKNMSKCQLGEAPCAICGKGVGDPWPHTAIVVSGGADWGDEKSPQDDGHLGEWPIGSDCHKRHWRG